MKVVFKISLRLEFQIYENNMPSITPKKMYLKLMFDKKLYNVVMGIYSS